MTVNELLTKLQTYNRELPVKLCDEDGNVSDISEIGKDDDEVTIRYEFENEDEDEE